LTGRAALSKIGIVGSRRKTMKKARIGTVLLLGIGLVWGLACSSFLETEIDFAGINMEPTIMDGQVCTVDENAYIVSDPKRGHVVLFIINADSFISRVIGLPGETITLEDGAVYIDGTILNETYLPDGTITESDTKEFKVPDNYYFVMGDNRTQSNDSRTGGSIPLGIIEAKVLHCEFK
jgi:signal peptidase I